MDINQDDTSSPVEVFQHENGWVARHKAFSEHSGAGETQDEAIFELMTILENLQASTEDEGC